MSSAHRVVQATAGAPLRSDAPRRRPIGRIGGAVGFAASAALRNQLAAALGPDAQVLDPDTRRLVVDHDCCWLDNSLIATVDQWQRVLDSRRLGDVEGAFALVWLSDDGNLTLARDAIGERSLFYAILPIGIIFASNVHSLLAMGLVERNLSLSGIATYLTYAYLPGWETLIEGVHELLPGEVLEFPSNASGSRVIRSRLWWLPPEPEDWADETTLRSSLRTRLEEAVLRRLPGGKRVGASLSGGLDSSLVVALACRLHDAPVHTYSISFGAGHANELPFSSLLADYCRTEHRIVELSPAVILRYLDESIALLSDPIGDPLTVPNALAFREAASEVGVVLNGEGGDPCFGGPKNLPMLLAELYDGAADVPRSRERSYLRAHLKCYDDLESMLLPEVMGARATLEARLTPLFEDPRWRGFVSKLQGINVTFKGGHHILPKVDAESAPFGVLARSPLFDRAVVELSFRIPPQLKLCGSVEKYLLKEAVRDLLPRAILERPKSGMLVPVEGWFRGALRQNARERLLDGLAPYRLFRRDYLERLLDGHLGGLRPRHGAKIWLLVTLEAWLRCVFSRRQAEPSPGKTKRVNVP
jgi:asparagine synthase (glutamine-hydrolysing)